MPEIKTRQRKNQPVMNTAQQQMQRNFVRSKAEQAAHRQSEQSDSPSNYAEEKISRTAEDAVRDGASLAVREIRSLHQRNNDKHGISSEADMPEEYQKAPAKWAFQKPSRNTARSGAESSGSKNRPATAGKCNGRCPGKLRCFVSPHCPKANSHP